LAEVAKEQSVFEFSQVRGTLVGLRGPDYVRGLGVPGWHWHFLTLDRTRGGHVLDLTLDTGQARIAPLRRLELLLPERGLGGLDLARDRTRELQAVEGAAETKR
jgi:acetolactate decarboxylase